MTAVQLLVRGKQSVLDVIFLKCDQSVLLKVDEHISSLPFLCFGSTAAIGPDGLCCQSREFKEWHGCRSTKGVTKGAFLTDDDVTFNINIYLFPSSNDFLALHASLCPGKYYYEVTCQDQGLCRVGWSTGQAALDLGNHDTVQCILAILKACQQHSVSILFAGTDKHGFGFGGTGKKSNNKQFDSYGEVVMSFINSFVLK